MVRAVEIAIGFGIVFLLTAPLLGASVARAGVPRSCIHPNADPIECPRDTRRVMREVLPSARVRELQKQRPELERTVPLQAEERNEILREIRRMLRYEYGRL
jgi:hypothetical protein